MHAAFPDDDDSDVRTRTRIGIFIAHWHKEFEKRPPFVLEGHSPARFPRATIIKIKMDDEPAGNGKPLDQIDEETETPKTVRFDSDVYVAELEGGNNVADNAAVEGEGTTTPEIVVSSNACGMQTRSKTRFASSLSLPVTSQLDKTAQIHAWAETNPLLSVPGTAAARALSSATRQKLLQHADLQGHFQIACEDVRQQQAEMDSLRQEIASLQKEKEERESQRRKEEEERKKEKQRNTCLDSSIERLLEARNEELRKSNENKQQLDALRAARASLQYDVLGAAADDSASSAEEDELALGAE